MTNGVSTLLRLASRIACLIVIASFALFAIDQAGSASAHQQNEVNESSPATAPKTPTPKTPRHSEKDAAREVLDEASATLTSPFKVATTGTDNQWAIHIIDLVLALLVYGFAVGYLARMLRVRV